MPSTHPTDDAAAHPAKDQNGVASLARGLRVLAALNDLEAATISRLVAETGLAKSTLIRLLQTLIAAGYAKRDPDAGTYEVTPKVASLARALIGKNQVDDQIQTVLDSLAEEIKWPTEFLVPDGLSMVIRLNNRVRAPIQLRHFDRRRFPMGESAAGLAYLAALPAPEQGAKVEELAGTASARSALSARIAETSARGYAGRQVHDLAPNLSVVSVSVPGPVGAMSMVYFDDVVTDESNLRRHLPALHRAAGQIAAIHGR